MNVTAVGSNTTIGSDNNPHSIKEAAEAFEALFIGQLLKSAREARSSAGLDEGDNSGSPLVEMADEHLAQQIAKGGGCGLAKAILKQMEESLPVQNRHSIGSRSSVSD